jgi:hypothetical protein
VFHGREGEAAGALGVNQSLFKSLEAAASQINASSDLGQTLTSKSRKMWLCRDFRAGQCANGSEHLWQIT